jgi:hypothetical protein
VYAASILIYFISAAVIIVASLALMVQFSLPYNQAGTLGQVPRRAVEPMMMIMITKLEELLYFVLSFWFSLV